MKAIFKDKALMALKIKLRLEDELAMYRVRTFRLSLRLKDATGVTYTGDESLATEEPTADGGTICR